MQILFDYNISDSFICYCANHQTQRSMDSASKQGLCAHMHQTLGSEQVKDPLMTSQGIRTCSSLEQCMCENSVDIFLFLFHFVISVELRKKAIAVLFCFFLTDFLLLRKPHLLSRTCSPQIKPHILSNVAFYVFISSFLIYFCLYPLHSLCVIFMLWQLNVEPVCCLV